MFCFKYQGRKVGWGGAAGHVDLCLRNGRAVIVCLVNVVNGCARDGFAGINDRLVNVKAIHPTTTEFRQQRRVNVNHLACILLYDLCAYF